MDRKEYLKEYRKKNREKINRYQTEWRQKNKDKVISYQNKYWNKKNMEGNHESK